MPSHTLSTLRYCFTPNLFVKTPSKYENNSKQESLLKGSCFWDSFSLSLDFRTFRLEDFRL